MGEFDAIQTNLNTGTDYAARMKTLDQEAKTRAGLQAQQMKQQSAALLQNEQLRAEEISPERAADLNNFYNTTLGHIDTLRHPELPDLGGTVASAGKAEAVDASAADKEKPLEEKAKDVVLFNTGRLDELEKTGQLPPPLPLETAESNLKTVVDYLMKSSEVPTENKADMEKCLAQAREMFKKNPNLPFPLHLAQAIGQSEMPPPFALSGIDFTRAYQAANPG